MTAALGFARDTHEVRVVFGSGSLATLPAELERCGTQRVLLVSTPGRTMDIRATLGALGTRLAGVFDGARMHVPRDVLDQALVVVANIGPDSLLAYGGGSSIGLGKALALETGLSLGAIPTTYSGSEMTTVWGISSATEKRTGRDPRVGPRLVIYDPELTLGLATDVSATSGMNAIAHGVEALYAPDAGPMSSRFAQEGLRRLAASLPAIMTSPRDPAARAEALTGAHFAGRALDLTTTGLHHKLAHILGGSFGLPHAATHAALLPWVAAWNAPAATDAMAAIATALGTEDGAAGLLMLARRLGTPTLSDLGFTAEMIPRAAALATAGSYPNPRPVDEAGVRSILACALEGRAPT